MIKDIGHDLTVDFSKVIMVAPQDRSMYPFHYTVHFEGGSFIRIIENPFNLSRDEFVQVWKESKELKIDEEE